MDDTTLSRLAESGTWKVYPPNGVVFWEEDVASNLFYWQYGSLKVLKSSSDGREQVLKFIEAGEILKEVGVLAKRPNPASHFGLDGIICTGEEQGNPVNGILLKKFHEIRVQNVFEKNDKSRGAKRGATGTVGHTKKETLCPTTIFPN